MPDGFTITTQACIDYLEQGGTLSETLMSELQDQLAVFSTRTNKAFSSSDNLLLVSVRSGAIKICIKCSHWYVIDDFTKHL